MTSAPNIDQGSELGRNEQDMSSGEISRVEASNPSELAYLVGNYGLWNFEEITDEEKVEILTSLRDEAETAKQAAIETENDLLYRKFATVVKVAELHLSDNDIKSSRDLWDEFEALYVAGHDMERAKKEETEMPGGEVVDLFKSL